MRRKTGKQTGAESVHRVDTRVYPFKLRQKLRELDGFAANGARELKGCFPEVIIAMSGESCGNEALLKTILN